MPYEWRRLSEGEGVWLWPHRSLPIKGFVGFIGVTCTLIALPLLAVLGTPVLWGLLPFFVVAVSGLWYALQRSYRDGQMLEVARLVDDRITVERINPDGSTQDWTGQAYWVQVRLHPGDRPVKHYLTLKGGGREIELGRFLTPEERQRLGAELMDRLNRMRQPGPF